MIFRGMSSIDGIMIDKWNMRINEAMTVIIIKTDND